MSVWNFGEFSNNKAIIDEYGNTLTYNELADEGMKISKAVGRRCLVIVLCRNTTGSVAGYVSFVNNNIVPMLLSSSIDKDMLYNIMKIYKPAYLWIPKEQKDDLADYCEECVYEFMDYILIRTNYDDEYEMNEELCLLLATSGSTGSPKFVRQSYNNVKSNAESIAEYLDIDETERPITTLPMNYTYGLSIINSHMTVGAALLVTDKGIMQKQFWNFFSEYNATSFGGVPYTYEMLDKMRFYRMKLPSLRYMTQAGGKLLPELHKKFAEYAEQNNKKFIVMYGQCEATARMGYLPYEKSVEKCGSMGIAIPGGKFRLIDVNGDNINEPFITGELVYEGDNVTLGYAECTDDLAKGDERHGILYTGDMAQFDKDGYYYIVGRKKRFLKVYGNRVSLDEIDMLIKGRFSDIECASAGIDDNVYIFIVNADDEMIKQVKNFISAKTKLNHTAFTVMSVDAIPKNDSGKILYRELEKYYVR
ncbi:MAG: AMP-binding protein [Oscillospiraceae bacterium]